jgi:ubiquinone/menaquinone biosynthesis C-methylase UbiE
VSVSSTDSKERFSSRVDAYVAARPAYPPQVIEHLRGTIGLTNDWAIADLGSGTGISCDPFLRNGNTVYGVEPNAAMRQAAEQSLRAFAKFKSISASAEATTLPDRSIDLIVAAQAFHWFDIDATRRECQRILKPDGWALLMWNDRKLSGTSFLDAYEKLLVEFGTDYMKVRHNNVSKELIARFFTGSNDPKAHGWLSVGFPNRQHLDLAGLRSRLLSSSYIPQASDSRHALMLKKLEDIFTSHNQNGRVTIEYQTQLFYGHLT